MMNVITKTAYEATSVLVIAIAVGFGTNALRGHSAIKPFKNYFDKGLPAGARVDAAEPASDPAPSDPTVSSPADDIASEGKLEHGYQKVSFAAVVELFYDPNTAVGVNVFIDARNDEAFSDGHIPGALQCNPYQLEKYIYNVLDDVLAADKVVVYCSGGDCEDSIFACRDLLEFGVSYDSVYLFGGGWEEWISNGMPVAEGREE